MPVSRPYNCRESDRHFFKRRVAGALAEPDHGDGGMRGAGLDGR